MPLILRQTLDRKLTHAELDGNFLHFEELISEIVSASGSQGPQGPQGLEGPQGGTSDVVTFNFTFSSTDLSNCWSSFDESDPIEVFSYTGDIWIQGFYLKKTYISDGPISVLENQLLVKIDSALLSGFNPKFILLSSDFKQVVNLDSYEVITDGSILINTNNFIPNRKWAILALEEKEFKDFFQIEEIISGSFSANCFIGGDFTQIGIIDGEDGFGDPITDYSVFDGLVIEGSTSGVTASVIRVDQFFPEISNFELMIKYIQL